jgi:hypothetical protein
MKNMKSSLTLFLVLALVALPLLAVSAGAQDPPANALMRGYRTGYSDGYSAGLSDSAASAPRDFRGKSDYKTADRGFHSSYGPVGDFRDGYRQGFEAGYNAGYDRRAFDSTVPADLKRRDETDSEPVVNNPPDPSATADNTMPASTAPVVILRDTIMRVELLNNLSTDASQRGDHFQARVIEPREYEGATIEGHVGDVKRPGKVKGTALLQLSFDQIRLTDGRSSNMSAQVVEVLSMSSSRNVDKVDPEGGVRGDSSTKSDAKKVGGAAGIGAIIGLIVGGGAGAAVGATIGAGVGTAGVLTSRGKDLALYQGQHLRIRTAGDATIQ